MSTVSLLTKASSRQIAACEALLYGLIQQCSGHACERSIALALVSSHPGAGVSHISELIEQILNENEENSAIALDCCSLGYCEDAFADGAKDKRIPQPALAQRAMLGRFRDRAEHLSSLRESYSFVLLDCHSLNKKTDILGLARMLDGVLVVVEANKTTRSQLDYLERSIELAGGKIVGCVLNKRTHPIPGFINSWMERMGI